MEEEIEVELSLRINAEYICANGHTTIVPFSAETTGIPPEWDCEECGEVARLKGSDELNLEKKEVKNPMDQVYAKLFTRHGVEINSKDVSNDLKKVKKVDELETMLKEELARAKKNKLILDL